MAPANCGDPSAKTVWPIHLAPQPRKAKPYQANKAYLYDPSHGHSNHTNTSLSGHFARDSCLARYVLSRSTSVCTCFYGLQKFTRSRRVLRKKIASFNLSMTQRRLYCTFGIFISSVGGAKIASASRILSDTSTWQRTDTYCSAASSGTRQKRSDSANARGLGQILSFDWNL